MSAQFRPPYMWYSTLALSWINSVPEHGRTWEDADLDLFPPCLMSPLPLTSLYRIQVHGKPRGV